MKNPTEIRIHELLQSRWSPYAFDPRPLSIEDLHAILEAARWAPSAFNEQPWRYIIARREDSAEFQKLLSCLVEANQEWAQNASILALGIARNSFSANGKPNRHAFHDLGLASASLTFEATSRGLVVHQMGGILPDRARELYSVPEGFEIVTGLAIGYAASPDTQPDHLKGRDERPRTRRSLAQTVFTGAWESPALSTDQET